MSDDVPGSAHTSGPDTSSSNFWIGVGVVVLAFFTVVTGFVNIIEDRNLRDENAAQSQCLVDSFSDLTVALQTRANNSIQQNGLKDQQIQLLLEGRELNAEQLNNLVNLLLQSAQRPGETTPEERQQLIKQFTEDTRRFQSRGAEISENIEDLNDQIDDLADAQKGTPVPPYPKGKCD